eukprot:GFKZ01004828.1.p1 GENE.GFKZ01004828.1~~GFKZ01004828.1.p1  ORF type:complete len:2178 (+),score=224.76 GFKZ01004828.1:366-6899(+)
MVGVKATNMSFTALNTLLRTASINHDQAKRILLDHKDCLFQAVDVVSRARSSGGQYLQEKEITYRSAFKSTSSHPKPTEAELAEIDALQNALRISRPQAALLLRDYLQEAHQEDISNLLTISKDMSELAPLSEVEDFWINDRHRAFSCLVIVCKGGSPKSNHSLYHVFADFLSEYGDELKSIILNGVIHYLKSLQKGMSNNLTGIILPEEHAWLLEVLFACCLYRPLTPGERVKLLKAFVDAFQSGFTFSQRPSAEFEHVTTAFACTESTALFAASINLSNGLAAAVQPESDLEDIDSEEHDHSQGGARLAHDNAAVTLIDETVKKVREINTADASIVTLSWAAFLRMFCRADVAGNGDHGEFDAMAHVSAAVAINVLAALRSVGCSHLAVDEVLVADVHHVFWVDFVAFLSVFPPAGCEPSQIENIVELAIGILGRTSHDISTEIAQVFWEREMSGERMLGLNTLLRLSSAVYPLTYRPLVSLLTSMTVSQRTAELSADYLANSLCTLAEHCDVYRDTLHVLDDQEDMEIWQSIGAALGPRFGTISSDLAAVFPEDEKMLCIQAGEDIPPDAYRSKISRGSIGVANSSLTSVTWVTAWNGFHASDHILRILLQALRDHSGISVYGEEVLSELLLSALESMKFLDRLCRTGSKDLRNSILRDESRLLTVSDIASELADPGDWVRGSWLTKSRREVLLTVSSSCLASMTTDSADRAQYVLERIAASKNTLPLQAALSALGAKSFPAVAALSRIAGLCSHGEHISKNLLRKISSLSQTSDMKVFSELADGYRGGTSKIYSFLRGVALPLWLTTAVPEEADSEAKSLHWLLPACSLHLFSTRPSDVLHDPAISGVLASVFTGASHSMLPSKCRAGGTETFLFPALRAALISCYVALRERNSSLQNAYSPKELSKAGQTDYMDDESKMELTALEKLLLKPDVIYAMAIMSSGGSERLKREQFYSAWTESDFRGFLPELHHSRYLALNATEQDVKLEKTSSWRTWVEDMCARCLALQFCCLAQISGSSGTIQAPWPTMNSSSFSLWRGGAESIRNGYARRIRAGHSLAVIELMVTIVSCGQRAAARSLMGSSRKESNSVKLSGQGISPTIGVEQIPEKTRNAPDAKEQEGSRSTNKDNNEILSALVDVLRECRDDWVAVNAEQEIIEDTETLMILGQKSLLIASSVRFLRICWQLQNSKWFRTCWEAFHVWELLASLLRCEGAASTGSGKIELSRATCIYQFLSESFSGTTGILLSREGAGTTSFATEKIVLKQSLLVDISSAWKTAASDCLSVFSEAISNRTSESLILRTSDSTSKAEKATNENGLPRDLFAEDAFTQFASVFTERWMHVLLSVEERYMTGWSDLLQEEFTRAGEVMDMSSNLNLLSEFASAEDYSRALSAELGKALGLSGDDAKQARVLEEFRRTGDIRTRFGVDYYFDVPAIIGCMKCFEVNVAEHHDLILDILHLNAVINRKDAQVRLISSFSEVASKVVFTDSFAPNPSLALTYSSPQFCGKLCRVLCRILTFVIPSLTTSTHSFAISSEIAKLMGFLSAYLSYDELEQPALTAVRFSPPPAALERQCSSTPLGQISHSIDHILASVQQEQSKGAGPNSSHLDTVRWLLLSGARLASGAAFRSPKDISAFGESAVTSLKYADVVPELCSAVSVAISSVLEKTDTISKLPFRERDICTIFEAISSLARLSGRKPADGSVRESAASLVLAVARIHLKKLEVNEPNLSGMLRHVSGGSILGLLPPTGTVIPTYDASQEARNSAHLVWCAYLQLSSVAIPSQTHDDQTSQEREQELRNVLEFCAANLARISANSLDLSGDWPSSLSGDNESFSRRTEAAMGNNHLTIGRVEEAEVASITLFRLSNYAPQLRESLPELFGNAISKLTRFPSQVFRLIRAEPIERWVRPVTRQERERSQLLRTDGDVVNVASHGMSPSPWHSSPSKTGNSSQNTPQKRSPSHALRAAIGGSGPKHWQSPGHFSPSPGMPGTPQLHSPRGTTPYTPNALYQSPASPWGPFGPGIITNAGVYFGEEVSRSLYRALGNALVALRRLSEVLDVLLFSPSMSRDEESPSLGALVAILYHSCTEVSRGAEGERRSVLEIIMDSALHLLITHVIVYIAEGSLTQAMRDEIRKRLGTVRARMLKAVPPIPPSSVIHTPEFEAFLYHLKSSI